MRALHPNTMPKTKLKGRPLTGPQKIALERMWRLIELAKEECAEHPERSKRYVHLIQNFSTRFRVSIPREIRNQFCKKCGNYWKMGETVTRRVRGNTINFNCKICGTLTRRKMKD